MASPPLTIDDFPLAEEADIPKPLSIDDFPMASGKDLEQSVSPSRALGGIMQLMDEQEQDDPQLAVARWGHGELSKWAGRLPFLGHAFKTGSSLTTARSANRIRDGKGDTDDYINVSIYLRQQRDLASRGFGQKVLDEVLNIPGFAQEFITTAGAFTAAKGVVGKALGGLGTGAAAKAVQAIVPSAAGVVAQAAANPTLTVEGAAARTIPDIGMSTSGGVATIGDERSFLAALPPAFLDTMIEFGSERAGGKIVGALGKIPGATRIVALKQGIVNRWLSKPGRTTAMLDETLKQAGWNGVIGEVLEERVGDIARLATGLESAEENVTGQLATGRYGEALEQLAIEGLAFSVPGAISVASSAATGQARANRLAALKAVRAKGYVSAEDGQTAGIEGATRKERLANADAKIQQLQQEIQDAEAIHGPEGEVRQPESGEDLRGEGQVEVPAEPAGEEPPPQSEILTSQELLDYLAAAEAAAPEVAEQVAEQLPNDRTPNAQREAPQQVVPQDRLPEVTEQVAEQSAEQPRDVAEEIRSALTSGPVTVTTPQVQGGFKVAKVRDDGKVVTKKGRVLTPDETWVVQQPPATATTPEAAAPAAQPQANEPPPELAQAGITIKSTPKGWSVTGIPKEIADGLTIDYQGKRAGKGYFFRQDPTQGLVDAAKEIAEEAERDAAERAEGRVKTSIGYLEPEQAEAFEQERGERLKLAKEEVARRNSSVDELLSQFVGKGQRGKFKLNLLRAAEKGDADTLKRFDEMVEYAKDHPELGLPADEAELFSLLSGESFTKDDTALLDDIDSELAAEIESFDFGANVPEVKQTAIPGTEEAVAAQERRDEIKQANKQVQTKKEKQKAFISGLGKDLPGQETMFDVDGLDGGDTDKDTTGTKNVKTDELRQKAGMAERPPVEPETQEEWDSKAQKRIADDPLYAGKLAAELAAKPRALDPVEEMTLNRHLRDLENRRQSGEDVADEMATAVEASERVGAIWGRAGVSRQAERAADFSLEGIIRQHVRSVNEKPSEEQMAKYAEMADRIAKLEGELNEERQKRIQAEIDKQIAASKKPQVEPFKRPKKTTERRQAAEKKVADAWENFRKAATTQAGAGPHLLGPAVEVATAYVELGYVRFSEFIAEVRKNMTDADENLFRKAWVQAQPKIEPEKRDSADIGALARELTRWAVESGVTEREAVIDTVHEDLTGMGFELSRSDAMSAMSGYGEFRELSKDEVSVKVRGIKGEIQQLRKLEDMQAGQAPKKTGIERREPTDEERRLIKEVNEAKKRGGYTVTDPERQLKSALASAKTAARNRIADLEKAIAAREKIVSGQAALKADAELADLRKRRDELNEEYKKIFPPKKNGLSESQRLKMAEKMLDRQLADLQADIDSGRLGQKEKRAPLTSPALEGKRQQLKSIKEVREQARAASPEYQAQEAAKQNARYKKTLERSLAFWENRRDEARAGRLPAKRKPTPTDKEILEKKYQIEQVRREAQAEIEEAARAARSKFDKGLGFAGDIMDLSRILMTTGEMSVVLMQGAVYTSAFPIKASKNLKKAMGAIFSRRADFAIHDDLMERPDHADMVIGGVETTVSDGPLSQREELTRSRIVSWLAHTQGGLLALPRWAAQGIQGFERGFRSFSNTMRADMFSYMKRSVEATRPGTWSESDMKWVGKRSNSFSGRGKLPGDISGVGLSRFFFAPRWVWSNAQMATVVPMIWKGDRAQRLAVAKVYVRGMLGMAGIMLIRHAIYALLAGDDEEHKPEYELDPRSSDFAKMRLGETRLGSMSGIASLITLAARIATGETKRADGKIVPIRGDDVPHGDDDTRDIIHRFLDSKLAPLPSAVLDFMAGENVVGDKATLGKIVGERTSPMTWRDIWDAEKELNVPQGTVAALDAFFGTRVSTYGSRTDYRDASEEERKKIVAKDLKNMTWDDDPKPAYSEFLTDDQLKKFEQRRQQKRGLVVYNATYAGDNEDELATRDKNRKYLTKMGVSFEEAQQLLKSYYRRPDEKGRAGKITEGYFKKLRALKRIYESQ